MSNILWISLYFFLNLLVTVTSKRVQTHIESAWLLATSHAVATFIVTSLLSWLRVHTAPNGVPDGQRGKDHGDIHQESLEPATDPRQHLTKNAHILIPLSLLYTLNIVVSNWTLGLVSLTMHQTIRATVPAITVVVSITILRKSWRDYSFGVYGALALTICGVIWAINATGPSTSDVGSVSSTTPSGFAWTFFGAILAVAKTIAANHLQKPSHKNRWGLGLSSSVLVRYCSLCSMCTTILVASWNGEVERLISRVKSTQSWIEISWLWLWSFNALATSLLNIASFETVKRCGPLAMGVASNIKQVAILLLDFFPPTKHDGSEQHAEAGYELICGSLVTVCGGSWYALASVRMSQRQRRYFTEDGMVAGKHG
ncbi:hypothetical protein H2200_005352 [Cladophialophora chaetospira]|uniref:Sugar phosphate transporter domain-containing protein n=1 Tax=Cladophialophora chaetospira TaxID=386627 RepID=A0AA39CJJ3_9EURO|nr:hypothetical protein H2200_005352 [Cladophialophora chaetospira]